MRKSIFLLSLAVFSVLVLGVPLFSAFAVEPSIVVTPESGILGGSFSFDITANSEMRNEEIIVEDPEGTIWRLHGLTTFGEWELAYIFMPDTGDSVRVTWPEAIFTVLNDPHNDIQIRSPGRHPIQKTDLAWISEGGEVAHTTLHGTYIVSFSGEGCHYFTVESFYILPESMFGTISVILMGFISFAVMYARSRPQATRLG